MKKLISLVTVIFIITALASCGEQKTEIVLIGDMSYGSADGEENGRIKRETVSVAEKTPMEAAKALSQWTGLDFTLNSAEIRYGRITADWSKDSTLIKGLDDREQKEEFFFYDVDTLSWFMMDSLFRTLRENFGTDEIFYTAEGGELKLENLSPGESFPVDIPYLGSPFYFSHRDTKGDISFPPGGTWSLDEEYKGAEKYTVISISEDGSYRAFAENGSRMTGYIKEESDKGTPVYRMTDYNGSIIDSFYLRDGKIMKSEGAAATYTRQEKPVSFSEKEIYISYPEFIDDNSGKINEDMKSFVSSLPGRIFGEETEGAAIQADYEIKYLGKDYISVAFSIYANAPGSAHPMNIFTVKNYDAKTGGTVSFREEAIKTAEKIPDGAARQLEKDFYDAFVMTYPDMEAIKSAISNPDETEIYYTGNAFGISFPLPYAAGSYAVIEAAQ